MSSCRAHSHPQAKRRMPPTSGEYLKVHAFPPESGGGIRRLTRVNGAIHAEVDPLAVWKTAYLDHRAAGPES